MNKKDIRSRIDELVKMHASYFVPDQNIIDKLIEEFEMDKNDLLPGEKDEYFDVVSDTGDPVGATAPRWLCHLVGLKHLSAHVILHYKAHDSKILILQVRSWDKSDSPGHVDISVGGHVKNGSTPFETACAEMNEEIGLELKELVNSNLTKILTYSAYNSSGSWFHNNEFCVVFEGEVKSDSLTNLRFSDGEVAGTYLCPQLELPRLREQRQIPIAPALNNFIIHKGK